MYELDSHKAHLWPERVLALLDNRRVYPLTIEIGLTSACNQKCSFCAFDYRSESVSLKPWLLKKLAWGAKAFTRSVVFSGDGEPTLSPHVEAACDIFHKQGFRIGLMTNGTWCDTHRLLKYLTWIRFSINAGSPQTYAKVHGVASLDYFKALENLEKCVKERNEKSLSTDIGVQCLILGQNHTEWAMLAKKVNEKGADYLSFKPFSQHPKAGKPDNIADVETLDLAPLEAIERDFRENPEKALKVSVRWNQIEQCIFGKDYKECLGAPLFSLVTAMGEVYPCAQFVGDTQWAYGNLNYQDWGDIAHGHRREEVLKSLRQHNCETCRKPCRLDAVNTYLHRIENRKEHDFFL